MRTFEIQIISIFPGTGANQNIVATREITALAGGVANRPSVRDAKLSEHLVVSDPRGFRRTLVAALDRALRSAAARTGIVVALDAQTGRAYARCLSRVAALEKQLSKGL